MGGYLFGFFPVSRAVRQACKKGVQVVMHNTLAVSEYALLDQVTFEPRPNYWSALLWNKLMGTKSV